MNPQKRKKISNVHKGNILEDAFYEYLLEQQNKGQMIDGLYHPDNCTIHKQKSYYCHERENNITFDVVIEIRRQGANDSALTIVFECKNHVSNLQEEKIVIFSDHLTRIFKHNCKGVIVVSSGLQSGAKKLVKKRGLGLVKYDQYGFETILERNSKNLMALNFIEKNFFDPTRESKNTKFAGFYDGTFFNSLNQMLNKICEHEVQESYTTSSKTIKYLKHNEIDDLANELLASTAYSENAVNLEDVCKYFSIELVNVNNKVEDNSSNEVLGEANFENKTIIIYPHDNSNRKRFTLAHEIGHFYLEHGEYLCSESVVENDLFIDSQNISDNSYQILEFQANFFASCLLLPKKHFLLQVLKIMEKLGINKRIHRLIYVDDQPCNYKDFNSILAHLSNYFQVSKQAAEIRLKKLNLVTDDRGKNSSYSRFVK